MGLGFSTYISTAHVVTKTYCADQFNLAGGEQPYASRAITLLDGFDSPHGVFNDTLQNTPPVPTVSN
eukprot:9125287-Pyramimonas_sp.AAC.1